MQPSIKRYYGYIHFQEPVAADCGDYFIFQHPSKQWMIIKGTIAAETFVAADMTAATTFALEQAQIRGRVVWFKPNETLAWEAIDSISHAADAS